MSEFILGCSFLLEESLGFFFFFKFVSNMQPEGSESVIAPATPAVLALSARLPMRLEAPALTGLHPSPHTYQERT